MLASRRRHRWPRERLRHGDQPSCPRRQQAGSAPYAGRRRCRLRSCAWTESTRSRPCAASPSCWSAPASRPTGSRPSGAPPTRSPRCRPDELDAAGRGRARSPSSRASAPKTADGRRARRWPGEVPDVPAPRSRPTADGPVDRRRRRAAGARCAATCTRTPTGPTAAARSRRWRGPRRDLGHEYMVLTDHSPRLTVANGLSPERLREQLDVVAEAERGAAPFRLLTGIEVDILDDGSLDQEDELLGRLDVVVASVHSKLRMDADAMTRRMLTAVANPHTDVLGHCTGRLVDRGRAGSRGRSRRSTPRWCSRPAERFGIAVEINSRPERLDPPRRLLRPGGRDRLPVLDRHRRARARPARLAALRLRAGRGVRRPARAGRQHLAGRRAARLDRPPRLTGTGSSPARSVA